ncbi:MAG: trimethylamine methyltransferase family protein [Clostridiales bacterium]|nr:trimethylamine methyltransferase family protein [Clostridiales bacterium]HBM79839.1 hypothetical protein [Clostridiaceae bacterium]
MKNIHAKIEVLTQSEIEAIHKSTLKILENVGLRVPNVECLILCEKAGAKVDRNSQVVRIPASVMERMLSDIRAAGYDEDEENIPQKIIGNISTQIFITDYKTQERRYGLLDDVMKGIALVQHLDNIPSCSAVTVPSDVPYNMTDVVSHQMIYSYSKKPGGTYILSPTSAKYIIQMANVVGQDVGYLLETVSPLQFRKESLEMALVFAKQDKPLYIAPMVVGGTTGPVTIAGTVTLMNTEILGSIFLIYALTNKLVGFYGHGTHSTDMGTMLCSFGSPNQALLGMASAQLGKFYGMKSGSNSALTDALLPDFQGGFEKAMNAIFSCLAGTVGIGCQGIVGADQGVSLEQLVIDNEWLSAYNYVIKGFEVNEDTIAEDLIERVGIGGNFVAEEHTAMNFRTSYWFSKLFNRDSWESWKYKNSPTLLDKAHEFVEAVTSGYKSPEPVIDKRKLDEINYIAKCADEELAKER